MGCAQSKVDNEEAVARCKDRKILMKEAVAARNAFAAGHSGYMMALKDTGAALNDYAHGEAVEPPPELLLQNHRRVTAPLPPRMIIENLRPPPPLPNFSPSPIKRATSMPVLRRGGKGRRTDSGAIAEEEENGEVKEEDAVEENSLELDRAIRRRNGISITNVSEISGLRGDGQEGTVESPSRTHPRTLPSLNVDHLASPMVPEVKSSMPWDYFYMMDNIPDPTLDLEELEENHTKINVADAEGTKDENEREVEPRTPERGLETEVQKAGGYEGKIHENDVGKQLEQTIVAPSDFMLAGEPAPTVNLMQVLGEIDDHFLKASESAGEVSRMLEATRLHYHSNFVDNRGHIDHAARVMKVITWNKSFKDVGGGEGGKDERDFEDFETHATVLDKLLAWDRKLYDEVKQGELMKLEYKRKVALLNKQKKRGATAATMEKTKAAVSHLHTRYIVDMQSLDSTVSEVSFIRDKQLYPKLATLVDGMAKMWASMCINHENQLKIMTDLKDIDVAHDAKETTKHHHERTKQLHTVVQRWLSQFEKLVTFQKQYIQSLNSWLKLNLIPIESNLKEKVTSPVRTPSLPIQHLLESWNDSLEKLPDELAKSAINSFAAVIKTIIDQQEEEMKLKEKYDETKKEFLKKNQSFDDWYQKYMQRRIPADEEDGERSNDGNRKDSLTEKQSAVESLKKRLEDELHSYQNHCIRVREKSLGSLKIRLPELFRALSDYSRASADAYQKLRLVVLSQQQ